MVATTSSMHEFMTAFVDYLGGREDFAGVELASGLLGPRAEPGETVQILGSPNRIADTGMQRWASLGNRSREEEYEVAGYISVRRDGAGETEIRDARSRAFELFAGIERALRDEPQLKQGLKTIVRTAEVSRFLLAQGIGDKYRWAEIHFEIHVTKRLPTN